MQTQGPESIKVVLLGESGTGKTAIVTRFIHDTFRMSAVATVGASFHSKVMEYDGREFDLAIWDTAGQEIYRALTPMYYRSASVAIVVFDVLQNDTFTKVESWLEEIKEECTESIIVILCGNKCDGLDERQVSFHEAEEFARNKGITYCETSAMTGMGILFLFQSVVRCVLERGRAAETVTNTDSKNLIPINLPESDNRSCC